MLPPLPIDEALKAFATDTQWAYYEAYAELRSTRKVGKLLGRARQSVQDALYKLVAAAEENGWEVPKPEQIVKGVSTLTKADGSVAAVWEKTKLRGMHPDDALELPDPKKVVSLSTMTDSEGRVIVQWAKEKPEDQERELLWRSFAEELGRNITRAAPVDTPLGFSHQDLLAVYPVGDHHVGMLAWAPETGDADYDIKVAETLLHEASQRLIASCPPCEQALIAFVGDFFHRDSYESVTPASKHLLDVDSRFPKMIAAGLRMIRRMIQAALERHQHVRVIFARGNHDPSTAAAITIFLEALYENEPRVSVDTTPMGFHYFEFGKNLLGVHHGDKAKMERLPAIMAHDQAEAWGRTKYRLWMTGHVHHASQKDFPGCSVESFEVLPPLDAYAAHAGYRSYRGMKAIVMHREHGEVERHTVRPDMLDANRS